MLAASSPTGYELYTTRTYTHTDSRIHALPNKTHTKDSLHAETLENLEITVLLLRSGKWQAQTHKHKHTHTDVFQLETVSVFYCCSDNQNNLAVKLCTDRSYLQEDRNASESPGLLTVTYDWWTGTRTRVRHGRFWDCWDRKTLCRRKLAEMKVRRALFASPPFWCFLGTLLL